MQSQRAVPQSTPNRLAERTCGAHRAKMPTMPSRHDGEAEPPHAHRKRTLAQLRARTQPVDPPLEANQTTRPPPSLADRQNERPLPRLPRGIDAGASRRLDPARGPCRLARRRGPSSRGQRFGASFVAPFVVGGLLPLCTVSGAGSRASRVGLAVLRGTDMESTTTRRTCTRG
jgi:hypothetical protein